MLKIKDIITKVNYDDGSLRDIVIKGLEKGDWTVLLRSVRSEYPLNNCSELPSSFFELIKARKNQDLHSVNINLSDGISLIWNFFVSDIQYGTLEIALDPREIKKTKDLKEVLNFLSWIGNLLNKDVFLTPENCHEEKIISYTPLNKKINIYKNDGTTVEIDCELSLLLSKWEEWSISANKDEDGWQSDFPLWQKLVDVAVECMKSRTLTKEDLPLLEKCWSYAEEDEELIDICKENIDLYRENLYLLSHSEDAKIRWQIYEVLKYGAKQDKERLLEGLEDPDSYCKRRAVMSFSHLFPEDIGFLVTKFMGSDDEYIKKFIQELLSQRSR